MQSSCAICLKSNTCLYNLKCSNCIENGFLNKLTCKECISKLDKCPWCRGNFDHTLLQINTWRIAPKISQVVSKVPKKTHFLMNKISKKKIIPKTENEVIIINEKNTCFDCCILLKRLQIFVSSIFMVIGISITGFLVGVLFCGNPNCYLCLISGSCGILFFLLASCTVSIALQKYSDYKYKFLCIGEICCTIVFLIILILSLGTVEGCKVSTYNLYLLLFILPCFFGITTKCICECASTND